MSIIEDNQIALTSAYVDGAVAAMTVVQETLAENFPEYDFSYLCQSVAEGIGVPLLGDLVDTAAA